MSRRKNDNTELGCMLGLLGGLLAILFTGSKKEKTVGCVISLPAHSGSLHTVTANRTITAIISR